MSRNGVIWTLLIIFLGLPALGLIGGYTFGNETIGFACGVYLMVAIPATGVIALLVVIGSAVVRAIRGRRERA
jgi:hypothetical protein